MEASQTYNTLPSTPVLQVKRMNEKAVMPKKGSVGAAGYDLCSAEKCVVPARGKYLVKTGLSIALPDETYGRVAPRSGLALKHSIDTGAGVIDMDYRGEVHVLLFNLGDNDFEINEGDRIAQLIVERIMPTVLEEVDELPDTNRGAGGFGSTGVGKNLGEKPLVHEEVNDSKRPHPNGTYPIDYQAKKSKVVEAV